MSEDKERDLENPMICVKERGHGHDKHSVALLEFTHKTIIFLSIGCSGGTFAVYLICHVVEV
jgi:hypothetical protein